MPRTALRTALASSLSGCTSTTAERARSSFEHSSTKLSRPATHSIARCLRAAASVAAATAWLAHQRLSCCEHVRQEPHQAREAQLPQLRSQRRLGRAELDLVDLRAAPVAVCNDVKECVQHQKAQDAAVHCSRRPRRPTQACDTALV